MRAIKIAVFVVFISLSSLRLFADAPSVSTPTPSATDLLNQELLTVVHELMQPNEDCQLPCFWGFIPGTSRIAEIEDFWTTIFEAPIETTPSEDGRTFASFRAIFVPRSPQSDISVTMTFKDDVLWLLKVSTFNTAIWLEDDWLSLPDVLQDLPDSNLFFVRVARGGVTLILLNTKANIMIQRTYQLLTKENIISSDSDEPLLLCPTTDNLKYTFLFVLDAETPISIEEILGNQILLGDKLAPYQPIEFMTNLNSDEFSDFIQENPEDCVEMLSYSELLRLGYGF